MNNLLDVLWRNQGQVLTPELILGLSHALAPAPTAEKQRILDKTGTCTESYKDVVFQIESIRQIFDEVAAQHRAQWDEVEPSREGLNPNYEYIFDSEDAGRYLLFTSRKDGRLVGNVGCYLYPSLHTQKLSAREDALYIVPDSRKGMLAVKFFKYCEGILVNKLAVEEITISTKTTNEVHKLWERQGYKFTDRILTKTFYRIE